jgi:uncharacterized protein YggU (UPF0235/DUF167 family)
MSSNRKFEITDARGGAAFTVRVTTRAEAAEIMGVQDDGALKIRLTAAGAGDEAANRELVTLLASRLGVPASSIEIVAGANGREKILSVEGISTADVEAKLGNRRADI